MAKTALVLLADGFEEVEAATPIDVLRRAGVDVTVAGVGKKTATGAHGLPYTADVELDSVTGDFDCIVLPGGMPGAKNLGESAKARELAVKMAADGRLVASICAAPVFTLSAWGLIDGRKATCYPGMEGMLTDKAEFVTDRVVVDGNVTTSRGPGTAMEFALCVAGQLMGDEVAKKVAGDMLVQ
ncbi:MAG: DJ-1/PfpI family protein [Planctomycetaceae bacterium]|nr:DJ-1/PfpI family protein [Planctomycetaceae bacterium]